MFEAGKKPLGVTELLKISTKGLMLVSIGFLAYILASFFLFPRHSVDLIEDSEITENKVVPEKIAVSQPKTFAAYEQIIETRDIFKLPYGKNNGANEDKAGAANMLPNEVAGRFKVVGIILDKNPQAIIEDLKDEGTLFLSIGEKVGDAVLEDVVEGKVIFQYNDQRLELVP